MNTIKFRWKCPKCDALNERTTHPDSLKDDLNKRPFSILCGNCGEWHYICLWHNYGTIRDALHVGTVTETPQKAQKGKSDES